MPLAAPLPPFNHSLLCSSVFTTLPSIRETLVFTCTEPANKSRFSCVCEKTSKKSPCPRERHKEQKQERRKSPRGDRPGYRRNRPHLSRSQRPRRQQRKKRP